MLMKQRTISDLCDSKAYCSAVQNVNFASHINVLPSKAGKRLVLFPPVGQQHMQTGRQDEDTTKCNIAACRRKQQKSYRFDRLILPLK